MDLIFSILKQLASSLSPTQFLLVLILLVGVVLVTIKLLSARSKNTGNSVIGILSGYGETRYEDTGDKKIEDISAKLELILSMMSSSFTKIETDVSEMRTHVRENEQLFRKQMSDLMLLKRDFDKFVLSATSELGDVKHTLKMQDVQDGQTHDMLKDLIIKSQDLMQRTNLELEKLDQFMRSVIPEFRSDHKDISKDINDLSRDLALIERTIQNQLSNIRNFSLR